MSAVKTDLPTATQEDDLWNFISEWRDNGQAHPPNPAQLIAGAKEKMRQRLRQGQAPSDRRAQYQRCETTNSHRWGIVEETEEGRLAVCALCYVERLFVPGRLRTPGEIEDSQSRKTTGPPSSTKTTGPASAAEELKRFLERAGADSLVAAAGLKEDD